MLVDLEVEQINYSSNANLLNGFLENLYEDYSIENLDLEIENPWMINTPSSEVDNCLHGFDWLNDLAALGNNKSQRLVKRWMNLWYDFHGNGNVASWGPEMTALRTINIAKNWVFVEKSLQSNVSFYFKTLKRQQFYLSRIEKKMTSGLAKARVLFALFLLCILYQESKGKTVKILVKFQANIRKSVRRDYGVRSRNPEELAEFFFLLSETLQQIEKL